MTDRTGQQLGNYRLIRLLGEGGFAQVYLGEHMHLGTQAAVKVLLKQLPTEKEKQGFLKEARTIAKLDHPHIIRLLEYGIDDKAGADNTPYMVMVYAPNGSLKDRHPEGEIVPFPTIIAYVKQVAIALQYAHNQGTVHRDVKPGNMLIGPQGQIWLGDFGIAVGAHRTRSRTPQTLAGDYAYTAPEQNRGQAEPASDQYALGITVYQWLSGRLPFTSEHDHGWMVQHAITPPPPLHTIFPSIPPAIEQVVLRALEKDPKQRFASVLAFSTALEQANQQANQKEEAIPTVVVPPFREPKERLPKPFAPLPGALLCTYDDQTNIVSLAWSANGEYIASLDKENTVKVWNAKTGKTIFTYPDLSSISSFLRNIWTSLTVTTMLWSPVEQHIALCSNEGKAEVWDVTTGSRISRYSRSDRYYFSQENYQGQKKFDFVWLPDGKHILAKVLFGEKFRGMALDLWEITTRNELLICKGMVSCLPIATLSQDGQRIAVTAWDTARNEVITRPLSQGGWSTPYYHPQCVNDIAWSPDNQEIATACKDGHVRIWDISFGITNYFYPRNRNVSVEKLAWSPNGKYIVSANSDGIIVAENIVGKHNIFVYPKGFNVTSFSWLSNEHFIASQQHVLSHRRWTHTSVWKLSSEKPVYTIFGAHSVSLSPDKTRIAFIKDKALNIWNVKDGSLNPIFHEHDETAEQAFCWSPDGTRIASIGSDGIVRVWQAV